MIRLAAGLIAAALLPLATQAGPVRLAESAAGPITLGAGPTRIALSASTPVGARVRSMAAGQRVYLVIDGLHSPNPPGTVYYVYLAPAAASSKLAPNSPYFVGTLSFFAATGGPSSPPASVSLDATEAARRIGSDAAVVIAPASPRLAAPAAIDSAVLMLQ